MIKKKKKKGGGIHCVSVTTPDTDFCTCMARIQLCALISCLKRTLKIAHTNDAKNCR